MLRPVRIGLLGGTFDPPHLAHLHAGDVAFHQLGLDQVVFMPAGRPWQKAREPVSESRHRWEMTRLATEGVDYFIPDDREVHRDGWTYTADTVVTFADEDEIVLILGADAACNLPTWERAAEVMARVELAVAPRAGVAASEVAAVSARDPVWLDMAPLAVSGSMLRRRAAAGESVRFLVRDSVWHYLTANSLYG